MWLRRLDRRRMLWIVPFQWSDVRERAGLTEAECEQAAWAITPGGEQHRGAGAVNAVFDAMIGRGLFVRLYRLPGIRQIQDALYLWVAEHRSRFPGVTPALDQSEPWQPQT